MGTRELLMDNILLFFRLNRAFGFYTLSGGIKNIAAVGTTAGSEHRSYFTLGADILSGIRSFLHPGDLYRGVIYF